MQDCILRKYAHVHKHFLQQLFFIIPTGGKDGSSMFPQIVDAIRDTLNKALPLMLRHKVIKE